MNIESHVGTYPSGVPAGLYVRSRFRSVPVMAGVISMTISIGDLVEVIRGFDSFDDAIVDMLNEMDGTNENMLGKFDGQLIEVTAVGENRFLGVQVFGESSDGGHKYGDCSWARHDNKEQFYSISNVARKVGIREGDSYVLLFPEMVNVWTRGQRS